MSKHEKVTTNESTAGIAFFVLPVFVKTQKNDEWYSFSINQSVVGLFFDDLLVDSWGHKWGVIGRGGGIFIFDETANAILPIKAMKAYFIILEDFKLFTNSILLI